MDLSEKLGSPLSLDRNNPSDSVLITIKSPEGFVNTAVIGPDSNKIESAPSYFAQGPAKKKSNYLKKIIKVTTNTILITFGLIAATLVVGKFTGIAEARIVMTGSMQPSIKPGDMIFAVSDNYIKPKLNDVVIYQAKRFDGEVVAPFAHRIVGGDAKTGWITKGDANEQADVQKPNSEDIIGVVILTIPNVGLFLNIRSLIFLSVIVISIYLTKEILRDTNE
jgi:signal peptidase I